MVEATKDHLQRDSLKRLLQGLGHLIAQINHHAVEQPRHPHLKGDRIVRATIEVGQAQQAFDQTKGILDAPPAPVQLGYILPREHLRIEDVRQIRVPLPLEQNLHQAQPMPDPISGRALSSGTAQGDQRVANGAAALEADLDPEASALAQARDEADAVLCQLIEDLGLNQPEVEDHQRLVPKLRPGRQALQNLGPEQEPKRVVGRSDG